LGKFYDFLFGKEAQPLEQRSLPSVYYQNTLNTHSYSLTDPEFAVRSPNLSTLYGQRGSKFFTDEELITLFHSVPEIFAPIHEIASRVSDAVWELKKWTNDEIVYNDADFNRLFSTPNPLFSFKQHIYQSVCYHMVLGRQYFYFNIPDSLVFDYKNISTWLTLPADMVEVEWQDSFKLLTATDLNELVKSYKLKDGTKSALHIQPDKILPINNISLKWEYKFTKGCSPLQSAAKAIDNLVDVYEARGVIYKKRGALGAIVSRKTDASGSIALTPAEKQVMRNDINANYGLTGGKDTYAVTDQPVDFIRFGMSIQELQPFEETLADASAIYATLGVPREMMPRQEGATFENFKQAEKILYQRVVIPLAQQYAESFTNYFRLNAGVMDTRLKRWINPSFAHVEVLQENLVEKSTTDRTNGEVYLQRFMNGICTLNEWVIATGNDKQANPLYDKVIFDMTPEELETIKAGLNMKTPVLPNEQKPKEEEKKEMSPLKKVV